MKRYKRLSVLGRERDGLRAIDTELRKVDDAINGELELEGPTIAEAGSSLQNGQRGILKVGSSYYDAYRTYAGTLVTNAMS